MKEQMFPVPSQSDRGHELHSKIAHRLGETHTPRVQVEQAEEVGNKVLQTTLDFRASAREETGIVMAPRKHVKHNGKVKIPVGY